MNTDLSEAFGSELVLLGATDDDALAAAADRLVRSGQQITAIAVDCGFASLSYFGKVFRQKFGCTPAQFRSKWQDITNTGR